MKSKVDEDLEEYSRTLEEGLALFRDEEENNLIGIESLYRIFKELKLDHKDYLAFSRNEKEVIQEALKRIAEEEELDSDLFLISLKRAFVLERYREDFDYMFNTLSCGEISITREAFVKAMENLPPLKANQEVIQTMIDIANGFPLTRESFQRLLVISGYIDQRIKALDSVLIKKNRSKPRKRTKT
jgi:hypothetical protein